METIRFLLKCIVGCIDSWVGASSNTTVAEGLIGIACIAVFEILFFIPFIIIGRKTNIRLVPHIFISIGIAVACVGLVCLVLIVVESFW